jgi:hypothetical protein
MTLGSPLPMLPPPVPRRAEGIHEIVPHVPSSQRRLSIKLPFKIMIYDIHCNSRMLVEVDYAHV